MDKKILIIDDEFPIRYLIEHTLRRKGFQVQTVKDGSAGLLTAREYRPDLIVVDIMMPDIDGFQVCREIREDPLLGETPVIFLTALMTKKDKLQAFEVGADDYLVKPFQADELMAHISAVLRRMEAKTTESEQPSTREKGQPRSPGRLLSLFSPKGGVGTTTVAIQLSEALAIQEDRPVVLIDLDLPLGGIAPLLNLYTKHHVIDLLNNLPEKMDMAYIHRFMQRHRTNLFVIPTPDTIIATEEMPNGAKLESVLAELVAEGYFVVLDLGSTLNELTLTGLRRADFNYVITSDETVANKLCNTFIASADKLGLDTTRVLAVVNELFGPAGEGEELIRLPIAHIPHASERSRTRLWVKEQGLRKLMSVALSPYSHGGSKPPGGLTK
jgi:CheY-like chemotaxis protein/MinD-like ATPase involved in chromosome partitioning or flagellar assembly